MILKRLCAFGLAGCMFFGCGLSAFAADEPIIETTEPEKPFDPFAPADTGSKTGDFMINTMYGASLDVVAAGIGFAAAGPAGAAAAPLVLTGAKHIYGFASAVRADYLNWKNGQGVTVDKFNSALTGEFLYSSDGGNTYHTHHVTFYDIQISGTQLAGATIVVGSSDLGDWKVEMGKSGLTDYSYMNFEFWNNVDNDSSWQYSAPYPLSNDCRISCDYLTGYTYLDMYNSFSSGSGVPQIRSDHYARTFYRNNGSHTGYTQILGNRTRTHLSGYNLHDYQGMKNTYHAFLSDLADEIGQENLDYILENLPAEPSEEEPTDPTAELLPPIEYPDLPFQTMPSYDFELSLPEKALASARFWFKYFGMFVERFQFVELVVTCLLIGFLFWLIL